MKISVVIPTHNRPRMLRRTLEALEQQTLPRDRFEVLAVDDGSDEENRRQARELRPDLDYRLIEKPQGGLASTRNRGAEEARGRILLFLDDDVVPAPDALEEHLRSHESHDEPCAVVGSLPYPEGFVKNSFLWYLEHVGHYDLYRDPKKYPEGRPPMPPLNGNSSLEREVFERIGRYDETFRRYGSEDLDLGYRLARAGIRFVYNPRAVGHHYHLKNFPQFCVDMETAGESLIGLYRRYPEIRESKKIDIVEAPFSALPWRKRAVKFVLTGTLAFPWLLAAPRATVRLLGGVFSLRRLLVPCYRWVAHYHYAVGMRRGLAGSE